MYMREIVCGGDSEVVTRLGGEVLKSFHFHSNCVSIPYTKGIEGKVRTKDDSKIIVIFSDRYDYPDPIQDCLPMQMKWPFDFEAYLVVSDQQKRQWILDALHAACLFLAKRKQWDPTPFEDSYAALMAQDLCATFISKKQWVAPNQKIKVRVGMAMDLDRSYVFVVVYKNRSQFVLQKIPMFDVHPVNCWSYMDIRQGEWLSPTQFAFSIPYRKPYFVDIPEG